MANNSDLQPIQTELEAGIQLAKCQKCGCMGETLDQLAVALPTIATTETEALVQRVAGWRVRMQPIQYSCLGCKHCYPAVAQNALVTAFPMMEATPALSCDFQTRSAGWPPVVGEYFVVNETAPVAVSTLASVELAEILARHKPAGLSIVGKTETENIGVDKLIKNIITNASIHYLIVAGPDSTGHNPGQTLLALTENGVDAQRRVIDSPGQRPILRNVSVEEIAAFRQQVQVVNLIGCDSTDVIEAKINALAKLVNDSCGCGDCNKSSPPASISSISILVAEESDAVATMDKAGYFVIVPLVDRGVINVEHYAYDNSLLHTIEGSNARNLYRTIIANGWVTELSHAAYLGRELTKAELSIIHGFKYIQDGA